MMLSMRFPEGRNKAFSMSYDDGAVQDIRLFSIMKKHGLRGTFNISTGLFSENDAVEKGKLSYRQALELYRDPDCEVAIHAYTHQPLAQTTAPEITRQLYLDKAALEKMFGYIIRGMAYPFGSCNETVIACMNALGIEYSRTTAQTGQFGIPDDWRYLNGTCHHDHPELTELGEKFLASKSGAKFFCLWGHSHEFDKKNNWETIERFAELIGGHDDVWYATNIEVCDYVKAYRNMRISSDANVVENPTAQKLWFARKDTLYSVAPGERIHII